MRICVFCGSNEGREPSYKRAAIELGALIAKRGYGTVYGGAKDGLMGAVADGALAAGGEVIGVLPAKLRDLEVDHPNLSELHIVDSMHERKGLMAELSDAFISLPGGIGTFEETFEIWTWTQLGIHRKPLALYNVNGFYSKLEDFLDHVTKERFVRSVHREMMFSETDPDRLIDRLIEFQPPLVTKWIEPSER